MPEEANTMPPPAEAPAPLPEPVHAPPERLEENDFLAMQNLNLQLENQSLLLKNLDLQRLQVMRTSAELSQALEAKRVELTKKYGTPIRRETVTPEGVIIRNGRRS